MNYTARMATEVVCLSPGHAEEVRRSYRINSRKITVHPIGVRPADANLPRTRSVVCVGRFLESKGQRHLLRGLAGSDLDIHLVGAGPDEAELRRLAQELDLDVTFTGWQTPDQAQRIVGEARVSVLLSNSDALPLAAIESIAAGTPVVASANSGTNWVLRDGSDSLIVDRYDPAAVR